MAAHRKQSRHYYDRDAFNPRNVVVLQRLTPTKEIWAYYADWKGKTYLHLEYVHRDIEGGEWRQGKGLVVGIEHAPLLLDSIAGLRRLPARAA